MIQRFAIYCSRLCLTRSSRNMIAMQPPLVAFRNCILHITGYSSFLRELSPTIRPFQDKCFATGYIVYIYEISGSSNGEFYLYDKKQGSYDKYESRKTKHCATMFASFLDLTKLRTLYNGCGLEFDYRLALSPSCETATVCGKLLPPRGIHPFQFYNALKRKCFPN